MKVYSVIIFAALLAYSCRAQIPPSIVLINCEECTKERMATLLNRINSFNPKVIALDVYLDSDTEGNDNEVLDAMQKDVCVILPMLLISFGEDVHGKELMSIATTFSPRYLSENVQTGFVSDPNSVGSNSIPLSFLVSTYLHDFDYYHFSILTAMAFDSLRTSKYIRKHGKIGTVNFMRERHFPVYSSSEILTRVRKEDIEGRIVMLGYLGPLPLDKFISPLNKNPKEPDMCGMEYLARIVAQVLDE